uniref:Uncharacterized protein ycf35 n=1 Tax=Glaucocystis incrassata TaxID=1789788 RepID=A0A3G1IV95_9EUKA|nr:hypothetical protein Ycf35 [Glaucocystis incrassata]ASQ39974.1 hypothetical protein Ycf35 [Glaucocystis incrassata]
MSHLTQIQTTFVNLNALKMALKNLGLKPISSDSSFSEKSHELTKDILISPHMKFNWTGGEYTLMVDLQFWQLPWSFEGFIQNLTKQYAYEVILQEANKKGFRKTKEEKTSDGSVYLTLERSRL